MRGALLVGKKGTLGYNERDTIGWEEGLHVHWGGMTYVCVWGGIYGSFYVILTLVDLCL